MKLFVRLVLGLCAAVIALIVAGFVVLLRMPPQDLAPNRAAPPTVATAAGPVRPEITAAPPPSPLPAMAVADCGGDTTRAAAAADNAQSLTARAWAPWGRPEQGWEIYLPLIAHEIGSACAPSTPGFAEALVRWQGLRGLTADGVMSPATFEAMRVIWLRRRPFVAATAKGDCPPGHDEASLAAARPDEGYAAKPISLKPEALAAYRAMLDAARRESPAITADKRLLTIFSGYRAPAADEARCEMDQGCGTPARARCSAHRTGTAVDLFVGAAPGSPPESSDDANRLAQSQNPAYRWLVANAARFGFTPYPFEPWHWEWTGAAVAGR